LTITTLSKQILLLIVFLLSFFIYFIFIHSQIKSKTNTLNKVITSITKLPNIRYSTSFYEPNIKEYKDYSYSLYFEQRKMNYLEFIYEN